MPHPKESFPTCLQLLYTLLISASAALDKNAKVFEEVVEVPELPFPNPDITRAASEINNALRDAAYVAVGLGVLGFQRAQVHRVELAKQLEGLPDSVSSQLDGYLREARRRACIAGTRVADDLSELSRSLEDTLDPLRAPLLELARAIEGLTTPARQQLDERIDRFEQSLPEGARGTVKSFRDSAAAQQRAWRSAMGMEGTNPNAAPEPEPAETDQPEPE
jgi:hypothetical protein